MSRKSFSRNKKVTPATVPTQALRPNVAARATSSAGIIKSGHRRSRENKMRATAVHVTSISRPEYVM